VGFTIRLDHIMPLPRLADYLPPDRGRTSSFIAGGDVKEMAMKCYILAGLTAAPFNGRQRTSMIELPLS
jgi:hypothetical protein